MWQCHKQQGAAAAHKVWGFWKNIHKYIYGISTACPYRGPSDAAVKSETDCPEKKGKINLCLVFQTSVLDAGEHALI